MGLLLSIFFSYVGAVEFAFIVRDIVHQIGLHQQHIESNRSCDGLKQIQQNIRDSLNLARSRSQSFADDVADSTSQFMQDGVQYDNGYRVTSTDELAAHERWMEARNAKANENSEARNGSSDDDANIVSDHSTVSVPSSSQDNSTETVRENESWSFVEIEKRMNESADTGYPESLNEADKLSERTSQMASPTSSSINEMPDMHFDEYSDEQMRAMDGIKQRSLVRNDGNRRRRLYKKSTSSTSSSDERQEKRKLREEELDMFTSLEEEEFEMIKKSDYKPLQYSSEPNLKRHLRNHNRSPVRRRTDSEGYEYDNDDEHLLRKRNVSADDTISDPWGDVKPEHYHDTELWKRERAMSIAENDDIDSTNEEEFDAVASPKSFQGHLEQRLNDGGRSESPVGLKATKSSSFEAATDSDHERVTEMLNNGAQSADADVSFISLF